METLPVDEKLETIYQDIIGNLMICPGHRPKGIRSPPFSSLFSLMNPELTSEHMISLVRERLNQQLSGSEETDSNTREQLVKLFCIKTSKHKCVDYVDLWPFFDSVLDETFAELETHVAFPGAEPNANLISIIAKRSPYLNKLKLNFIFYSTSGRERISLIPYSLDGLNSLHHLRSLTLYYLDGCYPIQSFLALTGKNCSSLTHLRLAKTNFISKYDILTIMLGDLVEHLIGPLEYYQEELCWRYKKVDWTKDAALGRLRVPPEFLTSLCFTLRHLEVSEYAHQRFYSAIDPHIAAFILRHIPNLEVLESCTGTEKAVHLLRKETEAESCPMSPMQQGFEQCCRDAVNLQGLAERNPRELVDRPFLAFSGTLSLTKLEYVYLNDENIADMLRAIGLTCPQLKEATFVLYCIVLY